MQIVALNSAQYGKGAFPSALCCRPQVLNDCRLSWSAVQ